MSNDHAIHPLNPADRNPNVDYLGHAVSSEEFDEEDTDCETLCEGCGQVDIQVKGAYCHECLRANLSNLKKAS